MDRLKNLDISKMTLIVVDMQNDFVRQGAPFEIPGAINTIPIIRSLCEAFQNIKRPIVFTRFVTGPCETLIWRWSEPLRPPIKACWRGVSRYYNDIQALRLGVEIVDELLPFTTYELSYVVDKYGYGAFHNTQLEDILIATQTSSVVIVGAAMPVCVNETVAGAFARGYEVIVPKEAVASFSNDWSKFSLQLFEMKYGIVISVDELLRKLEGNHDVNIR